MRISCPTDMDLTPAYRTLRALNALAASPTEEEAILSRSDTKTETADHASQNAGSRWLRSASLNLPSMFMPPRRQAEGRRVATKIHYHRAKPRNPSQPTRRHRIAAKAASYIERTDATRPAAVPDNLHAEHHSDLDEFKTAANIFGQRPAIFSNISPDPCDRMAFWRLVEETSRASATSRLIINTQRRKYRWQDVFAETAKLDWLYKHIAPFMPAIIDAGAQGRRPPQIPHLTLDADKARDFEAWQASLPGQSILPMPFRIKPIYNGIVQIRFIGSLPSEFRSHERALAATRLMRLIDRHNMMGTVACHVPESRNDPRNHHLHAIILPRPAQWMETYGTWDFAVTTERSRGRPYPFRQPLSMIPKRVEQLLRDEYPALINNICIERRLPIRINQSSFKALDIDRVPLKTISSAATSLEAAGVATAAGTRVAIASWRSLDDALVRKRLAMAENQAATERDWHARTSVAQNPALADEMQRWSATASAHGDSFVAFERALLAFDKVTSRARRVILTATADLGLKRTAARRRLEPVIKTRLAEARDFIRHADRIWSGARHYFARLARHINNLAETAEKLGLAISRALDCLPPQPPPRVRPDLTDDFSDPRTRRGPSLLQRLGLVTAAGNPIDRLQRRQAAPIETLLWALNPLSPHSNRKGADHAARHQSYNGSSRLALYLAYLGRTADAAPARPAADLRVVSRRPMVSDPEQPARLLPGDAIPHLGTGRPGAGAGMRRPGTGDRPSPGGNRRLTTAVPDDAANRPGTPVTDRAGINIILAAIETQHLDVERRIHVDGSYRYEIPGLPATLQRIAAQPIVQAALAPIEKYQSDQRQLLADFIRDLAERSDEFPARPDATIDMTQAPTFYRHCYARYRRHHTIADAQSHVIQCREPDLTAAATDGLAIARDAAAREYLFAVCAGFRYDYLAPYAAAVARNPVSRQEIALGGPLIVQMFADSQPSRAEHPAPERNL